MLQGFYKKTEEHNRNISKALMGRQVSEVERKRLLSICRNRLGTKKLIKKNCNTCNKEFSVHPYREKTASYCSQRCIRLGKPSPRKGVKLSKETRIKIGLAGLGRKQSQETINKRTEKLRGQKRSIETRRKISEAHKGSKNPMYGKEVSDEFRAKMREISLKNGNRPPSNFGTKHTEETKTKMREKRILNPSKVFRNTKIELKIEAELKKLGIQYQKQVPLCKTAIVDFYIPAQKIVIQADGCYWHGCPQHFPNSQLAKKERDSNQEIVLKKNGFNLYRFWEHEINKSVENCINKINLVGIIDGAS